MTYIHVPCRIMGCFYHRSRMQYTSTTYRYFILQLLHQVRHTTLGGAIIPMLYWCETLSGFNIFDQSATSHSSRQEEENENMRSQTNGWRHSYLARDSRRDHWRAAGKDLPTLYQCVLGIASENSADQFLKNITRKKTILIFSAILAKRGNLNLDLNLDLQRAKFEGSLTFYIRGSWIF